MPAAIALLLTLLLSAAAPAQGVERDFAVRLQGQHVGWMSLSQREEAGLIISTTEIFLRLSRGPSVVEVRRSGEFRERVDGTPISMRTRSSMGGPEVEQRVDFTPAELTITTIEDGRRTVATRSAPRGSWLAPAAAARYVEQRLAAGAREIAVRTIDPTAEPDPILITRREIRPETVTIDGRAIEAYRAAATTDAMPEVVSTEHLDTRGFPLRFSTRLGALDFDFELAPREVARAVGQSPDIMVATAITPDRPLPRARAVRSATLLLRVDEGALGAIPSVGLQHAEPIDAASARVELHAGRTSPASAEEARDPRHLAASALVSSDDEEVRRLARAWAATAVELDADGKRALPPSRRALAARALMDGVHRHIARKDLDTGMASAAHAARSRAGDCTEHAVLLAAALRALGVPSRLVAGVIYVESQPGQPGVFGYHLWTQALVEGDAGPAWLDLDPTIPPEGWSPKGKGPAADAARVALAVSPLADGERALTVDRIVPLMGRLRIEIKDLRHDR